MTADLFTRLGDEIERLDLRLESQSSLPPSKIEQVAALLRECKAKLYDLDPTIERIEYGEPDPVEHDRVAAALETGGTIADGARVLGVSRERMKHLIIQHRVEWPRGLLKEHLQAVRDAVKLRGPVDPRSPAALAQREAEVKRLRGGP